MIKSSPAKRHTFPSSERTILEYLEKALRQESVRKRIESIAVRVEQNLRQDADASLTWEPVPLDVFQKKLPETIRSSWVFAVRSRTNTGAESHPNSHQRMMSYRGTGDLQIWNGKKWDSNHLTSDHKEKLEHRWISIPADVLHQAVAGEENWIVVSFHTVPAEELIEERPDPSDPNLKRRRRYLDR